MLVTMKEIVDKAHKGNYAVAAPSVATELDARAVLDAATEMRAPLILDVSPTASVDMQFLGSYLVPLVEKYPIPVAINLDHGKTFEDVMLAIRSGFTSVMLDCSTEPFEENIRRVQETVRAAHALGISVEAELGHVGMGETYEADRDAGLTDPDQALEYIQRTGIDMLAVAIGTAHGEYKGEPKLDFERLQKIKQITNFPLVLHGGSGSGDENLRKACTMGINKVNINTDLAKAAYQQLMADGLSKHKIWYTIQLGYRTRMKELIRLFGSEGKADLPQECNYVRKEIDMSES